MSFLDSWGKAIEDFGGAVKAKIGLTVDLAGAKEATQIGPDIGPAIAPALDAGLKTLNLPLETVKEFGSTPAIAARLARRDAVQAGNEPGGVDEWRRFFSGGYWEAAYDEAQRTAGARSFFDMSAQSHFAFEGSQARETLDRFGVKNRFAITDEELGRIRGESTAYNVMTGTGDVMIDFGLDPLIVVGKGVQAVRASQTLRPIKAGEDVTKAISQEPTSRLARMSPGNLKKRTDSTLSFIRGKSANEIYNGVEGIKESTNGMAVATALAKAGAKETDEEARLVLRVAYGDSRAQAELAARDADLADLLAKAKQDTNDLLEAVKWEEVRPGVKRYLSQSEIEQKYAERLKNLRGREDDLQSQRDYLQWMNDNVLDTAKRQTLRVTTKSRMRADNAANGVIQKNLWSVPSRIWHNLTTQHQRGMVELDAPDSVREIQAMFDRVPDIDPGIRNKILSEYIQAPNPGVKYQVVERAKAAVMAHKAKQYGYSQRDAEKIFNDFLLEERKWFGNRGGPPQRYSAATDPSTGLPVDTIIDDGVAEVTPQLLTQLANRMPTLNVDLVDRALKRSKNRLTALADRVDELQKFDLHGGADAIRRLDQARWGIDDARVDLSNTLNRWWKFSVLARLGYPLRVLTDDHMRIYAKLGGAAMALQAELAWSGIKGAGRGVGWKDYRLAKIRHLDDQERREEIIDELSGYEGFEKGNEDLINALKGEWNEIEARLTDADKLGVEKVYQAPGARLGEGMLKYRGATLADAFGGADSSLRRQLASQEGMHDQFLEIAEGRKYNRSARAGNGWTQINPEEPGHTQAWLEAVNKQLRQDPMAEMFIRGASEEDVLRWLRKEPAGRQHAKQLPFHGADQERWVSNVRQTVDQYIPDAEWRQLLANRQLTEADIKNFLAKGGKAPAVHGAGIDANLGKGAWSKMANSFLSTTMKYLSEIPSDRLSRHPLYVALYRQRAKQEVDYLLEDPNRALLGKGDAIDEEDLARVYKQAHAYALKELKNTLYDISAHSNAAHALRFVSPFMGAWQETLGRWWGLTKDRPQILQYFVQAWQAPNRAGLVVDRDGQPVDESSELTDDEFLLLQLPAWAGGPTKEDPLRGQKTLLGQQWRISKSSFNITLQGDPWWLPGAGPVLQIPIGKIANEFPTTDNAVQEFYKFFNPYGYQGAVNAALPATAKRIQSLFAGEKQRDFAYDFTMVYRAKLLEWDKGGQVGPKPTMEQAKKDTKSLYMLKVANNLLSPFPAQEQSPYQFYIDAYHALQEQGRRDGRKPEWTDDTFVERYGEEYFAFVQSISQNNLGLQATAESVQASKKYSSLIARFPEFAKQIVGDEGEGEFNEQAYAYQLSHGYQPGNSKTMRSFKDPVEAQKAAEARAGWREYRKLTDVLDAVAVQMGAKTHREVPALVAYKRMRTNQMGEENMSWREAYKSVDADKFERQMVDLKAIANDRQMQGKEGIQQLKQYISLRETFTAAMEMAKQRGIEIPRSAFQQAFASYVGRISESNTRFSSEWFNGYLEHDPLLPDIPEVTSGT